MSRHDCKGFSRLNELGRPNLNVGGTTLCDWFPDTQIRKQNECRLYRSYLLDCGGSITSCLMLLSWHTYTMMDLSLN